MKKIIKFVKKEDIIELFQNDEIIATVSIADNDINIKTLYQKMKPEQSDKYEIESSTRKIEKPHQDIERLFNNLYDFMRDLINELNTVLVITEEE